MGKREETKIREEFSKAVLIEMSAVAKKSGWRKYQDSLICVDSGFFFESKAYVYLNKGNTSFTFSVKPYDADTIFWKIMSMEENEKSPLSLRSNGAFVCSSLPLAETIVEDDGQSASYISEQFLEWSNNNLKDFLKKITDNNFSRIIKANKNFLDRGSYSETLICTLISENSAKEARAIALDIVSGKKPKTTVHITNSKSFYEHAESWIESNA